MPSTPSSRCWAAPTWICRCCRSTWPRVPDVPRRVYDVARTIPPGTTLSYGEIADRLGCRGLSRAVGQALGRNPFLIVVPCHRVLAAGGRLGGFSANGGITTKLRLLAIEGRQAAATPSLFDGDGAFGFDQRRGRGASARVRPGHGAAHRRGRAVRDGAQDHAEPVCGAGRVDRLPAAHRQGRRDHLRARAARCSHAPITGRPPSRSCASATSGFAAPASRTPSCSRCATSRGEAWSGELPTLAEVAADGRRGGDRRGSPRCAASAAGPSRCC